MNLKVGRHQGQTAPWRTLRDPRVPAAAQRVVRRRSISAMASSRPLLRAG